MQRQFWLTMPPVRMRTRSHARRQEKYFEEYIKQCNFFLSKAGRKFHVQSFHDVPEIRSLELGYKFWSQHETQAVLSGSYVSWTKFRTLTYDDVDCFTPYWTLYTKLRDRANELYHLSVEPDGYLTVARRMDDKSEDYMAPNVMSSFKFDNFNCVCRTFEPHGAYFPFPPAISSPILYGEFLVSHFGYALTAVYVASVDKQLLIMEYCANLKTALPKEEDIGDMCETEQWIVKHLNNVGPRGQTVASLRDICWPVVYRMVHEYPPGPHATTPVFVDDN